jgi:hypothetical protein
MKIFETDVYEFRSYFDFFKFGPTCETIVNGDGSENDLQYTYDLVGYQEKIQMHKQS